MERSILIEELNKISSVAFGEGIEILPSIDDDFIILRFVIGESIFYTEKNERFKVPITNQRKITLRQAKAYITAFNESR
jgi:hypothetical protein